MVSQGVDQFIEAKPLAGCAVAQQGRSSPRNQASPQRRIIQHLSHSPSELLPIRQANEGILTITAEAVIKTGPIHHHHGPEGHRRQAAQIQTRGLG
jgi:hypothetical protein